MWWQALVRDFRYAFRMFVRNPVFTLLAIVALTLGIGANTAIFTIVNGVLLKPLPYGDPDRLVMVWSTNAIEHRERETVAPRDFVDYRSAGAFEALHATYGFLVPATMTGSTGAEQMIVSAVTPGTFEMLGRTPLLGRTFTEAEASSAIVVSHAFWQSRLGSGSPGHRPRPQHPVPAADDRRGHAARLRVPLSHDARAERVHACIPGGRVAAARARRAGHSGDRSGDADRVAFGSLR